MTRHVPTIAAAAIVLGAFALVTAIVYGPSVVARSSAPAPRSDASSPAAQGAFPEPTTLVAAAVDAYSSGDADAVLALYDSARPLTSQQISAIRQSVQTRPADTGALTVTYARPGSVEGWAGPAGESALIVQVLDYAETAEGFPIISMNDVHELALVGREGAWHLAGDPQTPASIALVKAGFRPVEKAAGEDALVRALFATVRESQYAVAAEFEDWYISDRLTEAFPEIGIPSAQAEVVKATGALMWEGGYQKPVASGSASVRFPLAMVTDDKPWTLVVTKGADGWRITAFELAGK